MDKRTINQFDYFSALARFLFTRQGRKNLLNPVSDDYALIISALETDDLSTILSSVKEQHYSKKHFDCYVLVRKNRGLVMSSDGLFAPKLVNVSDEMNENDALDACMKSILKNNKGKYLAAVVMDAAKPLPNDFMRQVNNAAMMNRQVLILGNRFTKLKQPTSKYGCVIRMDAVEQAGGWPFKHKTHQINNKLRFSVGFLTLPPAAI